MAGLPTDRKSQQLLALAVAAVIGGGLYWWYLWSPAQDTINTVAAHADTLDTSNALIKKEITGGMEARLRADANRYTNELAGLRRLVPTEIEVPALLDAISNAARQVGLEVSDFAPDAVLTGQDFDMLKFRMGVTGSYHKVGEFLSNVGSLSQIISPINVTVAPSGRTTERRPGRDETFIDAKFGVMTYVAKTKLPAPIAPAPAPAKPGAK